MKHAALLAGAALAGIMVAGTARAEAPGGCARPHHPRPAFAELDADGDGALTRAELAAHHAARFARADADGDGKLSLEEMQVAARARADARAAAMLERLDTDGDGMLSAEEMPKPRHGDRAEKIFDRIDADDSGTISQQEFDSARERMQEKMRDHGRKGERGAMHRKGGCMDAERKT